MLVSRRGFNHQGGVRIETETFQSKQKRVHNKKLGPAWVLSPEDRSDIEAGLNHVEIESIEPRPTLVQNIHYPPKGDPKRGALP